MPRADPNRLVNAGCRGFGSADQRHRLQEEEEGEDAHKSTVHITGSCSFVRFFCSPQIQMKCLEMRQSISGPDTLATCVRLDGGAEEEEDDDDDDDGDEEEVGLLQQRAQN